LRRGPGGAWSPVGLQSSSCGALHRPSGGAQRLTAALRLRGRPADSRMASSWGIGPARLMAQMRLVRSGVSPAWYPVEARPLTAEQGRLGPSGRRRWTIIDKQAIGVQDRRPVGACFKSVADSAPIENRNGFRIPTDGLQCGRAPSSALSRRVGGRAAVDTAPGQAAGIQRDRSARTRGVLFRVPPWTLKHEITLNSIDCLGALL
jgi:hypothetical protein